MNEIRRSDDDSRDTLVDKLQWNLTTKANGIRLSSASTTPIVIADNAPVIADEQRKFLRTSQYGEAPTGSPGMLESPDEQGFPSSQGSSGGSTGASSMGTGDETDADYYARVTAAAHKINAGEFNYDPDDDSDEYGEAQALRHTPPITPLRIPPGVTNYGQAGAGSTMPSTEPDIANAQMIGASARGKFQRLAQTPPVSTEPEQEDTDHLHPHFQNYLHQGMKCPKCGDTMHLAGSGLEWGWKCYHCGQSLNGPRHYENTYGDGTV